MTERTAVQKRRLPTLPSKPEVAYLAFHEVKLALCLAGGLVTPWPRGTSVEDAHTAAGRLVWVQGALSASVLESARGGLNYGSVVLIETDLDVVKAIVPDLKCVTALPLACVTRVIFASAAALEEFAARTSAYGDLPTGLVSLVAEPLLFEITQSGSPGSFKALGELEPTGCESVIAESDVVSIDRQAGALATALWALNMLGRSDLVISAKVLVAQLQATEPQKSVPAAIADMADNRSDSGSVSNVFHEATRALAALLPSDGLDPRTLLREIRNALERGNDSIPDIVDRFFVHSDGILGGSRDLSPNAFSDDEGSIKLRGLLLFLLNPDADRIATIRRRTATVGDRVFLVAAALSGFYGGFASLATGLKGSATVALAVPRLSLETFLRRATDFTIRQTWHADDGRRFTTLHWRESLLVEATDDTHPTLSKLVDISKNLGLHAQFDRNTGELCLARRESESKILATICGALPVFPRASGVELVREQPLRLTKKAAAARVADLNAKASATGIFGSEIAVSAKFSHVNLHAYLNDAIGSAPLTEALTALDNAFRSGIPKQSESVDVELPLKFEHT